jgi:probable H4MPT-linked C1 transfer pathway protein
MASVIGWDIGGAHVKAARAQNGRIVQAVQIACAPHESVSTLEAALREASARLGPAERHGVAMTAELSDAFENRAKGVVSITAICARELNADNLLFYAGARGFVARDAVEAAAPDIASANWRASAELVARHCADALFFDMGSTTIDLVPIRNHAVAALGVSDADRLAQGELVYAGFTRGAPQAFARLAPVAGRWTPLVNENFATMADVRRVLGELPEGVDLSPTADGRAKTPAASRARLARLAGRDAAELDDEQWREFARFLARAQLRLIEDAIAQIVSRGALPAEAPVVGAGVGRSFAARLARLQDRPYRDFGEFVAATPEIKRAATDYAPAAAIALLLSREFAAKISKEMRSNGKIS